MARAASWAAPSLRGHARVGDRAHKAAALLGAHDVPGSYVTLMSAWDDPRMVVPGAHEPRTVLTDPSRWLQAGELSEKLRLVDQLVYLPDDILTKVDRAAMAASLETRIPLLDPRVVELAWSVPPSLHEHDGRGKYLLRELLAARVPKALTDRPKKGFGVPVGAWLRGPLRPWAEELLAEPRLRKEGYLDPAPVRAAWSEHVSGARDWTAKLWAVLMWQSWHERWRG
jgi:asparagine synthase (glutamine-hydrolysing)